MTRRHRVRTRQPGRSLRQWTRRLNNDAADLDSLAADRSSAPPLTFSKALTALESALGYPILWPIGYRNLPDVAVNEAVQPPSIIRARFVPELVLKLNRGLVLVAL